MKGFRSYLDYFYQIGALRYNTQLTINKLSQKIEGQVEIASQVMIMLNRLSLEMLEATRIKDRAWSIIELEKTPSLLCNLIVY